MTRSYITGGSLRSQRSAAVVPWIATILALASLAACLTHDQTEGTFSPSATGGIRITNRGRAAASEHTDATGVGYDIALDLSTASPPVNGFTRLIISTAKRPRGEARYVHAQGAPNDAKKTAWITLGTPAGTTAEWLTDSGTIDFRRTDHRHAVAGEFIAYLTCGRCGPEHSALHTVLRGRFETD
jgi:hypothetical protein